MSESVEQHRAAAPSAVRCAVITISDTRTLQTDTSGAHIAALLEQNGHELVARSLVPDDPDRLGPLLSEYAADAHVQAVLITGGTGISPRDLTYETVSEALTKPIPGFGELFRMLSFSEIGAAAMLSRAVAGLIDSTLIVVMPGSRAAVDLAMQRLVLPELGHLVREASKA
jgi:molybdenum cofactor biosynthesis protein B